MIWFTPSFKKKKETPAAVAHVVGVQCNDERKMVPVFFDTKISSPEQLLNASTRARNLVAEGYRTNGRIDDRGYLWYVML